MAFKSTFRFYCALFPGRAEPAVDQPAYLLFYVTAAIQRLVE